MSANPGPSTRLFTSPDAFPCDYAMIVGVGRSGTNWLLDLFDLAPNTFCRNEANALTGSPFDRLPPRWLHLEDQPELERHWDEVIRLAATQVGERDHPMTFDKVYVHALARRLGLGRILYSATARRALGLLDPDYRQAQWPLPAWFGNRARPDCLPVLKILQAAGWVSWVLRQRPAVRVIHIVRHPAGFLNSYHQRYLAGRQPEQVRQESRDRLARIARAHPDWGSRFGDLDALSIEEMEIWFWRYTAEQIHAEGQRSEMYRHIVYEQLTRDPVDQIRALYEECGLEWHERVEQQVLATASKSGEIASAWRDRLDAKLVDTIDRIVGPSPVHEWWDGA